jgi:hypothetical protein
VGKVCILRRGEPFHWACRNRNQARDSLVLGVLLSEVEEVLEAEDSATAEKDRAGLFDSDILLQILKATFYASKKAAVGVDTETRLDYTRITEGTSWSLITHRQKMMMWCSENSKFLARERF